MHMYVMYVFDLFYIQIINYWQNVKAPVDSLLVYQCLFLLGQYFMI